MIILCFFPLFLSFQFVFMIVLQRKASTTWFLTCKYKLTLKGSGNFVLCYGHITQKEPARRPSGEFLTNSARRLPGHRAAAAQAPLVFRASLGRRWSFSAELKFGRRLLTFHSPPKIRSVPGRSPPGHRPNRWAMPNSSSDRAGYWSVGRCSDLWP